MTDADLTAEFDAEQVLDEPPAPSWNVAPTDPVRMVVQPQPKDGSEAAVRQLRTARWGLVPSWSKDARGGARMINARIETVTSKPAFRKAAASRRCLLPALGYYEWQQDDQRKIPYFLHDPAGRVLAMAGLYEFWRDPAKADDDPTRWLVTCTVITQQAPDLLGEIHDRNPVVVPPELRDRWLDSSVRDLDAVQRLLDAIPQARLEPYVVSSEVNNVRHNGPQLIDPVATPETAVVPQQLEL
jgi:putative SOS response-associated peptidase YedK